MTKRFSWLWFFIFAIALASTAVLRPEPLWLLIFDLALAILSAFMAGVSWVGQRKENPAHIRKQDD